MRIEAVHVDHPRIADIWGARTPMDRSQPWPARVDTYVAMTRATQQLVILTSR